MKELKSSKKNGNRTTSSHSRKYPNMMTFHPTAEEKESLKNSPADPQKDLEILEDFIVRNCTLSIGCRLDSGAFYATLREKTENWTEARSLSAWHTSPAQALRGLAFALDTRFDQFPDIEVNGAGFLDEW